MAERRVPASGGREERVRTSGGLDVVLRPTSSTDHGDLLVAFRAVVAANEGYPQSPTEPVSRREFEDYWLAPAVVGAVARCAGSGRLVGAYTMKPNGVGRAAHVANAGYFVVADHRNRGLGEALVLHSMGAARAAGFDALQFNYVFASNPARRLYERLGFQRVGRIPEVIDGEDVFVYWRKL